MITHKYSRNGVIVELTPEEEDAWKDEILIDLVNMQG